MLPGTYGVTYGRNPVMELEKKKGVDFPRVNSQSLFYTLFLSELLF